jgi:hypothetical protein
VDDVVVTLDPNKLAEKKQRCLHIHNRNQPFFRPYITLLNQSSPVLSSRLYYDLAARILRRRCMCIPPDTKVFLYYFTSPEKPRIAGELRLRVVQSDDPVSFESGSDLLGVDGRRWSGPLYFVSRHNDLLYQKLREEGLVPDDLDAALSTLHPKWPVGRDYGGELLYTLNDPFVIDFAKNELFFTVITEHGVEAMQLSDLFVEKRLTPSNSYIGNHRLSITSKVDTDSVCRKCLGWI